MTNKIFDDIKHFVLVKTTQNKTCYVTETQTADCHLIFANFQDQHRKKFQARCKLAVYFPKVNFIMVGKVIGSNLSPTLRHN